MRYSVADYLAKTPPDIAAGRMNDYSLTEADMRVALALFNERRPRTVLDFGCNEGSTAAFLLDHCPWIEVWAGVDLKPELFPERGIVPKVVGSKARHHGDRFVPVLTDGTWNGFMAAMHGVGVDAYDAIIMDADHEEAATQRDTEMCAVFAKPGTLTLWHDWNVRARQHDNGRVFGLKAYLDRRIAAGEPLMVPDQESRDPWTCVSVAWMVQP